MSARVRTPGRDRLHVSPGRNRQVKLRCSEEEFTALAAAARLAGLTVSGYAAEAAIAAARGAQAPSTAPLRTALVEVMAARSQVRRFAVNVNQAVAALNATGQPPEWLADAVALTTRAVARLDEVAAQLAVATRRPASARAATTALAIAADLRTDARTPTPASVAEGEQGPR
ncbi:plasmid mobilization protein [Kineococcus sp. SYSU DK004]|uniref:plasmid mobilization protein n=1 Tax=Kineococcus sp. SYSU DK004 TaxID=3383125 RepID=UPI003D7E7D87